jgi:hypothetical protein
VNDFIARYSQQLLGVLSGFDRLVLRGNLTGLAHDTGMRGYLWASGVAWKDYAKHVEAVSRRIKQASLESIAAQGRPVRYLASGKESKEEMARAIARQDGITAGPVCAFTAVEPCLTWSVGGNRAIGKLQLKQAMRRCLFIYHYWIDAVFGFMSARLQTWFPFPLYVYLNGREWLSRQMQQAGMAYRQHDNCFSWIEDFPRAQQLMDQQLETPWPEALEACVARIHPLFPALFEHYPVSYYWTSHQTEWAMDVVFRDPEQLRRLYPQLIHLGMTAFSSPDVMRFLGKKVGPSGTPRGSHSHEVISDRKVRQEGVRIKHRHGQNWIKLYDKAYAETGAVLRSEVTINAPQQFRVFRHKASDPESKLQWLPLRAGIADLHRRAEVSQKALDRYSNALAKVDGTTTLGELAASIETRLHWHGRSVRALHPFEAGDLALLQAVNRGEFVINGLRNRDLQALLFAGTPASPAETRRRSAAVSRKLRMLRAHGVLQKLPHTHRYQVTDHGRLILNTVLSAQRTTSQQLTSLAA